MIGEEYKRRPDTDADRSAKGLDGLLYPGLDAEGVAKAKARNAAPFEGAINAHRHLADVDIPAALPKRGTEIALQAARFESERLGIAEAAKRLRAAGVEASDLYKWLAQRYPEGVEEPEIESIAARLKGAQAAGLRAVAG